MKVFLKIILLFLTINVTSQTAVDNLDIRYNQIGYAVGRTKLISINSSSKFESIYEIKNKNGKTVQSGKVKGNSLWNDAGEYVGIIDVTKINKEGIYTVTVAGNSKEFNVLKNPYQKLADDVFKYYYFNRASTELTEEYAGVWKRASGLEGDEVKIHSSAATKERPEGTVIKATKGWFDAGDYNMYVTNSGISTYTLLSAFENFENYYTNKTYAIPENKNEIPDLLDEVIWNLDWMLAMQDPNDGGVYHKLSGLKFSGAIMPDQYKLDRYVVKKSTSAALNFVAVCAIASRVFSKVEGKKAYSNQLLEAAVKAYDWAKKHPKDYFTNPKGVRTGQYEDFDLVGEFQWAAAELFVTSGNKKFIKDISVATVSNKVPWWQDASALTLYTIVKYGENFKGQIPFKKAKNKFLSKADELKNRILKSSMRIAMDGSDYVWGSNGVAGNQLMYIMKAYELTKDESYLDAVFVGLDYLLGRNGTGISYITGAGVNAAKFPHHRTSEADKVDLPVPGMVVGGPQPGQQDKCKYISKMPAKSYSDTWCSYASNEVTINWNAPIVYVVNALQYYQTKK
ncbi:glycoside hydrolase family 9 protein [uncultured Tenacibaculum sp.]|uniref:glycoside hydrolase family 9 protein n=1 Tax=uncultured Tenacibaculum sp. TaxID=174713 RepID=UPI002619A19E|nr:glycoside hydrolase family 9 protein [uncultured Tenacibaculum sp.]